MLHTAPTRDGRWVMGLLEQLMVEVHGFCDERFRAIEESFRGHLDSGVDKGASFAATLNGEFVVDLWGGTRDYAMVEPWESDTVVRVFSTSKPMVIITVLMLVDRGLLDLDTPVAEYWPEFAKHGKGEITTRQILVHKSGLPGFGRTLSFAELSDWNGVIATIENAELWYEPGTITCYSPTTFGYMLGELVRRLSGVPFNEFFDREVAEPLGADFRFSTPASAAKVSAIWPAAGVAQIGTPMGEAAMAEAVANREWIDPQYLPTIIPSGSGITNARALARIGSMLAMGGVVDARRYLSRAIIDEASREQSVAIDEVLGPIRYGLGFGLDNDSFRAPTPTAFHWGGYGGSFMTMDQASGMSAGFAQNQMLIGDGYGSDPRLIGFLKLLGEISNSITGLPGPAAGG